MTNFELFQLAEAFDHLGTGKRDEKAEKRIEEGLRRLLNLKRKRGKGFTHDRLILEKLDKLFTRELSRYKLNVQDVERTIAEQGMTYFLEILKARKSKQLAELRR